MIEVMRGKLFKIGQEVTAISERGRFAPLFGKIFTVEAYHLYQGDWYICLAEIPRGFFEPGVQEWFAQSGFAPVVSDDELYEGLEEVFAEPVGGKIGWLGI